MGRTLNIALILAGIFLLGVVLGFTHGQPFY
jgi:hypothetical protein